MAASDAIRIAQISDLHCGGPYFEASLLERAIGEVNELAPDIVVCSGDLTTFGFRHEYLTTREYLDPETEEPVTSPKANQLVRVKLTIKTGEQRHYVAVRDRLPAGLEPVNSRLATEAGDAAPDRGDDRPWWRRQTWVHTDLRDDGATAFADVLPAGEHVFEYNARATIPGTFRALPAEVEAMYEPEIRGRTAGGQMVVRR